MTTYHWNGEYWYQKDWGLWHRLRNWIVWVGGWERVNGTGWRILTENRRRFRDPTPISVLGHRVTVYGWGWRVRLGRHGWFVSSRFTGTRRRYVSPDGTAHRATWWLTGTPVEMVNAVCRQEAPCRES